MVLSVNTNVGAQVALQNLNATNAQLAITQNRINTGKSVASAKDNGAIWAIAQGQRADIGALNAVKQSLDRGVAAVDVALAAGETVSDLLLQMKEKALAATDASLKTAARAALNEDFESLRDQIASVASNAEFNGVNLLKTGATGFSALANAAGDSTLTVQPEVLALGSTNVTVATTQSIDTLTKANAASAR
jgi:flagellin